MRIIRRAMMVACLAVASASAFAQGSTAEFLDAKLVADVSSAAAGKPFRVGVLFTLKPEWHIYWKNPGESGLPTAVKWSSTPAGAQFGELQYPAPIVFETPGGDKPLISYGYEREVLLFSEVTAPAGAKEIEIAAKADFLVCKDRCVRGKQDLKLTIPVGDAKPANEALFKKYAATVPAGNPSDVKISVKTAKAGAAYTGTVTVDANGKEIVPGADHGYRFYFFPERIKGFTVQPPEIGKPAGGKSTISVKLEPEGEAATEPKLSGVLTYQLAGGEPKAVQIK